MAKPRGSKGPSVKQAAFFAAYSKTGVVTLAAEMAEIDRRSHSFWLHNDKDYPALFQEAHAAACDTIEAEMRRRAIDGVDKPVFYKGQPCGTVKEYSDTLLAMLANGAMPEKYKQKTKIEAEVTSRSREAVREGLRKLTEGELAEYERLLIKAMGLSQEDLDLATLPPASDAEQ